MTGPIPTVPRTLTTREMLHILRNPWGKTDEQIKQARLEAADEIEYLQAMLLEANTPSGAKFCACAESALHPECPGRCIRCGYRLRECEQ